MLTFYSRNNKCYYRLILMISIHYFFQDKQNCTMCVNQMTINDASISVLNYGLYSEKFFFYLNWRHCLKVDKSQKQILKLSLEPKNKWKYFCISALASKKGSNKKGTLYHWLEDFILTLLQYFFDLVAF